MSGSFDMFEMGGELRLGCYRIKWDEEDELNTS